VSDTAQNLRAFLAADATVAKIGGNRFHEDHVPQLQGNQTKPFIWFGLRQEIGAETLDSQPGEDAQSRIFDLECVAGRQMDAKQLASAVRRRCSCYRGSFGDSTTKGIFVRDKDSDYVPQSTGGDRGVFVTAFELEIWA
jgi:hypothetical protein